MKITWLTNSGFAIEKEGALVVIDCYDPRRHALLSAEQLRRYASVTVLASHAHGDHFSPEIFALAGSPAFVLSFDIPPHAGAHRLRPGGRCTVNGLSVAAFGSTDEGVSFHIAWPDGMQLFHAGDLNNWHWRDEGGAEYARVQRRRFLGRLRRIRAAIPPETLDAACFPVDPRMGTDYYRGAVQFARALRPRLFLPMHFGPRFSPPQGFWQEMAGLTQVQDPAQGAVWAARPAPQTR